MHVAELRWASHCHHNKALKKDSKLANETQTQGEKERDEMKRYL